MWRDVRYAARSLRHSVTFTLAATMALGLAIGANATIFSLVDGLWLRPPGFEHVGRSVRIFSTTSTSALGRWSYPEYTTIRDNAASFTGVVACGRRGAIVTSGSGEQELVLLNVVSINFFAALGIAPEHGRVFGPGDEATLEQQPAVVLGHAYWRRRFGGDPSIIGRTIRLGGRPLAATVLGVLPATFRELDAAADRDLWVAPGTWRMLGGAADFDRRTYRWFDVVAVRRPGVGVPAAQAEMHTLASGFAREFPDANAGRSARVVSDFDYRMETGGTNAIALLALVLFVVAITGVNVTNLMLSRAVSRTGEAAVRVALGASRRRLLREMAAEAAVVGAAGTALGVIFSLWFVRLLPALIVQPPGFQSFALFGVDVRTLAFTAMVAIALTLLSALAPAWAISRGNIGGLVRRARGSSGPGDRSGRFGRVLIVMQVAASVALVSAGAVLARSFVETRRADLGFSRKPMLTAWVPSGSTPLPTIQAAVPELSALPGVQAVAVAIRAPLSLSGGGLARRVGVPRMDTSARAELPEIKVGGVSANYFDVMGTRITEGRAFTEDDQRPGPPVVIVNERFATRFLAGERVGEVIRVGGVEHRVVGVAQDAVINRIGEPAEPYFFLPFWRHYDGEVTFLIEVAPGATVAGPAVREALMRIDPRLEPRQLVTMEQYIRFAAGDYQATAALAAALAAIGLLLTTVGVYGVIAYRVARRTKEVGIRLALGATRRGVLVLLLGEGGRLALSGVAIGLPAAFVTTHLIRSLLFGIQPWDAVAIGGATALLVVAVMTATLLPAWRAVHVNPTSALRENP